jgi:Tol biopolymer transport system component
VRDGHALLYSDGATVHLCDRDGGNRRELATFPGDVFGISMAPQGDRLRFYVDQGVNDGIVLWESQSDGARLRRVIDGWSRPRWQWGGSWNPDGRWFVFSARRDAAGSDVWLLGESGLLGRPALFRLTSGPMDFVYPIFSADGTRIFVVGISRRGELLRYDFKTREFTQFLGGMSAENVAFSPDGQSLTYVTYPEGRLWRSRADGSAPVPLTTAPMRAGWALWSPDGTRIAFAGQPAVAAYWNLYVSPAAGGSAEPIEANIDHAGFTWRGDSRALIVASDDPNAPLRVVDLEGRSSKVLPGTQHFTEPCLSNSGRYLLVKTTADTLAVFDLSTQRTKQLETAAAEISYPRWSADDRYVYFNRFLGTTPAVYRVRVADGFTERLMDLTEFSATGSWRTWSALAPDGSLLLLRDLGGVDLYAIDWSRH